MIGLHDPGGTGDPAVGDLYAVGWRAGGRPRQWVMAVYSSVEAAAEACRGYVRFDGVAAGACTVPSSYLRRDGEGRPGTWCWLQGSSRWRFRPV